MSLSLLLPCASALCAVLLAIVVLVRSKRGLADWMFAGGMLVLAVESLYNGVLPVETIFRSGLGLHQGRLLILSFLPGFWLIFSVTYARGNARESLRRWMIPIGITIVAPICAAIAFRDGLVLSSYAGANSPDESFHLGWAGFLILLVLLGASISILMNLERTLRAAVGTMHWRIKFMLLGVGVLFVVRIYTVSQSLLFGSVDPTLESINSGALLIAAVLIVRALFRTGKFALDVYPSQSVLQGSLTVFLAGIYLLVVGLFAKIVSYVGGDTAFALKAFVVLVAIVFLAIILQSDRVRLVISRYISRNFQRPLYDYRTVWRRFTEGTASRLDQTELCRELVKLMAEMFQALSVTIWLVEPDKHTFALGASTSISKSMVTDVLPTSDESTLVRAQLENGTDPVDFELVDTPWAQALRRWNPSVFPRGGHRVCLPIAGRGALLGVAVLGDRVAGAPFSVQDFDMLRCVGDHAAANLYNVQLSQKLVQAKELEAFQTMATFFVHDLKNAASTLKLMLQNLPIHFDDPEFRADALRGTAKTVSHIDNLIGRLGALRHELKVQPVLMDLNDIVGQILSNLETGSGLQVEKNLATLPKVLIDGEQFGKVVTNLVLNAVEASRKNSAIKVRTERRNDWIILSVSDQGCGMTPEFMAQSLFKPFKTTKKSGLGIGMFQSKLIVEAHAGRIAVSSQIGVGSTFEISLPVPKT